METNFPPECFADGIGEISITGGVVRIDFVSLQPVKADAGAKPVPVVRQRIIMPPDGFLHAFSTMENLVRQLEKTGAVKRQPAAEPGAER
ncbi:MAG: hypothetical protein ACT4P2_14290 [Pseudomonadota bacterium]